MKLVLQARVFPKLEEWSAKVQPEAIYQTLASPAACLVKIMLYDFLARVFSGSGWGRFGEGRCGGSGPASIQI